MSITFALILLLFCMILVHSILAVLLVIIYIITLWNWPAATSAAGTRRTLALALHNLGGGQTQRARHQHTFYCINLYYYWYYYLNSNDCNWILSMRKSSRYTSWSDFFFLYSYISMSRANCPESCMMIYGGPGLSDNNNDMIFCIFLYALYWTELRMIDE